MLGIHTYNIAENETRMSFSPEKYTTGYNVRMAENPETKINEQIMTSEYKRALFPAFIFLFLVLFAVFAFLVVREKRNEHSAELQVVFKHFPGYKAFQVDCPDEAGCKRLFDTLEPQEGEDKLYISKELPNLVCTEIYGGPGTVQVSGTINGEKVHFKRTRTNGCEIAQFEIWQEIVSN